MKEAVGTFAGYALKEIRGDDAQAMRTSIASQAAAL
jgi:hypothetical protein